MEIRAKFYPRPYQVPILNALNNGCKRAVWVAHRRAGKDLTVLNWVIPQLIKETCTCFYVMPTYSQGKKILWDATTNDGMRVLDHFPEEFVAHKNSQEMKIRFGNQSLFQIIGSENVDSLVGTNPKIIVFSEYALQNPQAWTYLSPILKVNNGTAIFISTPRGKNHFYDLYVHAKNNPEWFCERLTIEDTGVLTKADIEQEIREGMSEELAMQEYFCSFDRGVEGAYFAKFIDQARRENRIGKVSYDPSTMVDTYWDVGFGDATAIVFGQSIGTEFRIIDCYESSGEGLPHYIKHLQSKPYVYGRHFFPHDAGSGSFQTGKTIQGLAAELGIKTIILPKSDIEVGIEMARSLLSICCIDESKCTRLIKCLECYHKRYNPSMNVYSNTPIHDWSSHFADAFRYCSMARALHRGGNSALSVEEWKKVRAKYTSY